jgi:hypothetical protein
VIAHVAGMPVEETVAAFAPAGLLMAAALRVRALAWLDRRRFR